MLQTLRQPFRSIAAKVRRDKERPVVPQSIEKNSHSDQERPAVPLSTETNARPVQESTNILQSFVSENGTKLVSLPTHLFEDSLDRYLLWIDIQSAFEDIDYLQDSHGSRVQYVPDEDDVFHTNDNPLSTPAAQVA
ncbi:hypothetical protein BGZ74_011803 [Mortierella antarctica]|nr:hypothetical protein BGZ74_011803 [Mortierella antarctica]